MARGNQRDKAREKNEAKKAGQKQKTTLTGNQQAQAREKAAQIMKEKQKRAEERKAEEAAARMR